MIPMFIERLSLHGSYCMSHKEYLPRRYHQQIRNHYRPSQLVSIQIYFGEVNLQWHRLHCVTRKQS